MSQVLDNLRAVRTLLDTPDRWTQGAYARDSEGKIVSTLDPVAVRWCLDGAICVVAGSGSEAYQVGVEINQSISGGAAWRRYWNDARFRTHEQVLAMLDQTILRVEQRETLTNRET